MANSYATPNSRPGVAPGTARSALWSGYGRYSVPGVPESTDPDYTDGFSPAIKSGGSPDGTAFPDDIRTGHREPPVSNPNNPAYNARQKSDFHRRHAEDVTTVGWHVQQRTVARPVVPMWSQDRMPIRPTADASPTAYTFQRPWHIPRNVKDALGEDAIAHFSLADHRRNYEIYGMKPQGRTGTNTYRATPTPWDEQLFIPPRATEQGTGGIAGNRSWRL